MRRALTATGCLVALAGCGGGSPGSPAADAARALESFRSNYVARDFGRACTRVSPRANVTAGYNGSPPPGSVQDLQAAFRKGCPTVLATLARQ